MGDNTDSVNTALVDTSMLADFEPPIKSNPTAHGVATTRKLCTAVKLITLKTVDMATSPFA